MSQPSPQEKARTLRAKYRQSEKGKATSLAYSRTAKGKELNRSTHFRTRYGMSIEQFDQLMEGQQHKCAICDCQLITGSPHAVNNAHVDHNHQSGEVRGILCKLCNLILGHAKDSSELLVKCADYLRLR